MLQFGSTLLFQRFRLKFWHFPADFIENISWKTLRQPYVQQTQGIGLGCM